MNKVQSREQTTIFDTPRECSSSPCSMNEVDPSYLGYWSSAEVVVFLKSLLEQERIGTKAFADIGYAADLRVADLDSGVRVGPRVDLHPPRKRNREEGGSCPNAPQTPDPRTSH